MNDGVHRTVLHNRIHNPMTSIRIKVASRCVPSPRDRYPQMHASVTLVGPDKIALTDWNKSCIVRSI